MAYYLGMRGVVHTLAVVAMATGCARVIDLPPSIPAEGRVVREVEVAGNHEVKGEDITAGLETHPPEGLVRIKYNLYDQDSIAADRLRIESFLQKEGYFAARVSSVEAHPVRDRYIDVLFRVDQGEPTRLASVGIAGIPAAPAGLRERAFEVMEWGTGDRYTEAKYLAAKQALVHLMGEEGYPFAEVNGEVLVDKRRFRAAARFVVDTGQRVTLEEGSITGLSYFPAKTIAKRIAWKPGQQYTPELIKQTRSNILALQHFSTVRIGLDQELGTRIPPQLTIRESERNELRAGGGMAMDPLQWRVRLRGGYTRRGFLGPLNTLQVDLRPAYAFARQQEGAVQGFVGELLVAVDRIDFPADFFSSRVQAGYQVDEVEAFSTRGPQLSLSTSRRFYHQRVRVSGGWGMRLDDFFQIRVASQEEAGIPASLSQRVGYFDQNITADFRDQVLSPTRGFFARFDIEEGTPWAGGEKSYIRVEPEARGYYSPLDRLVLALRISAGADLLGEDLPVNRRFFSGGAARHRGFAQRTLSPTALSATPDPITGNPVYLAIGGSSMFETNIEARIGVYERYGMVVFADGGDVTDTATAIDLGNLHWAVGTGLRVATPIGPFRVDLGVRINRLGPGNPRPGERLAFHLSLGEAF